jgi:hypothetical protein
LMSQIPRLIQSHSFCCRNLQGRYVHINGGRVPRRLRQRADDAMQRRFLCMFTLTVPFMFRL